MTTVRRIVITVKNEVGALADVTSALAERNVNIESIAAGGSGESGIIIITTDDCDRALYALANAGFKAVTDDALIVRLRDEPGALAKLASRFKDEDINIQSVHILNRFGDYATVVITADDKDRAAALIDDDMIV